MILDSSCFIYGTVVPIGKIRFKDGTERTLDLTLSQPSTTVVLYANSLDLDETRTFCDI